MRTKTRTAAFPVSVLLVIAHILLFPNHLLREPVVRVDWASAVDQAGAESGEADRGGEGRWWYTLAGGFGYLDDDGRVLSRSTLLHAVTLTDRHYISYPKVPQPLVVRDWRSGVVGRLPVQGYPLLSTSAETVFVFSADLLGCSEVTLDGREVWSTQSISPLTSFAEGADRRALGRLDGSLLVVDGSGATLGVYTVPGGIQAVYGCDVSTEGDLVCGVFGVDPQTLLVLAREDCGYARQISSTLGEGIRREVIVRFTRDGRYVGVETAGGVATVDTLRGRSVVVPVQGRLQSLCAVGARGFVASAERSVNGSSVGEVFVMLGPGSVVARDRATAGPHFLRSLTASGGPAEAARFLVGQGGLLAAMEILYL